MIQATIEEMYNQHKPMILNRASYYCKKTGIEIEELIAEGNLAFCESLKSYDPTKSKFSTHLWHNISYATCKKVKEENRTLKCTISIKELHHSLPRINKKQEEFYLSDKFSKQAQEIIQVILENEIVHLSQLTKILLEKGYKDHRSIHRAYKEIKKILHSNKRR